MRRHELSDNEWLKLQPLLVRGRGPFQRSLPPAKAWGDDREFINAVITREKRLKKWRRAWKIRLIEEKNPRWDDLWQQILI